MPDTQTGVRLALAATRQRDRRDRPARARSSGRRARAHRPFPARRSRSRPTSAGPGRGCGRARARRLPGDLLGRPRAAGVGWAIVPSEEALALASLERDDDPRLVSNVEFSAQRVGGLATDVASGFLRETAQAAHVNLHVRLLEGTDPQHVLTAIYKAVGAALGQACRPPADEEGS